MVQGVPAAGNSTLVNLLWAEWLAKKAERSCAWKNTYQCVLYHPGFSPWLIRLTKRTFSRSAKLALVSYPLLLRIKVAYMDLQLVFWPFMLINLVALVFEM